MSTELEIPDFPFNASKTDAKVLAFFLPNDRDEYNVFLHYPLQEEGKARTVTVGIANEETCNMVLISAKFEAEPFNIGECDIYFGKVNFDKSVFEKGFRVENIPADSASDRIEEYLTN